MLRLPTDFGDSEIIRTIVQLEGHENVKNELISWFQTGINEFDAQEFTRDLMILVDFYDDKFQQEFRYLEQLIHGQEVFNEDET